jgi:hypothetical protein
MSAQELDSAIGIATDYGLDDRRVGIKVPVVSKNVLFPHVVQTGSGTNPASYLMDTGGFLTGR